MLKTRVAIVCAGALLLIAASQSSTPAVPPVPRAGAVLAEGLGQNRLIAICSGCHDAKVVVGQHHDEAGWAMVMDRMVDRGAQISDADYAAIGTYLAKHY